MYTVQSWSKCFLNFLCLIAYKWNENETGCKKEVFSSFSFNKGLFVFLSAKVFHAQSVHNM